MSKKKVSTQKAVAEALKKRFVEPKKPAKKPKVEPQIPIQEILKDLYTMEGKDLRSEVLDNYAGTPETDYVQVEVLDTGAPRLGLPRKPAVMPSGNYYETSPRDYVYAPVLPSDSRATVTKAPEYKPKFTPECCSVKVEVTNNTETRNDRVNACISAIQKLASDFLNEKQFDDLSTVANWMSDLDGFKKVRAED